MTEVELKFEIDDKDLETIFNKLATKAKYIKSVYELSEMYDLDSILYKEDARLRVRRGSDIIGNEDLTTLTYKKPLTREGIKIEIEHETVVEKYKELEEILLAIGFKKISSYERFKHVFDFGNSKMEIQIFPFANFLEIEGEEKDIVAIAKEFEFDLKQNLTDSCDTIDDNRRKEKGLPSRDHILFDDLEKIRNDQRSIIYKNKKK